jgi:hypothetical protein
MRAPDLQFAIDWRQRQQPNAAWAGRYRDGFTATTAFLESSEQAYRDERRKEGARARQRHYIVLALLDGLATVAATLFWFYIQAETAKSQAEQSRNDADKARAQLESALNVLQRQPEWEQLYQEAARSAPDVRRTVEQAAQSRSLTYLQYADQGQKALAERLRLRLEKAGYAAPGTELVATVPSRSELRYFREADAGDAAALAELLARWNWGLFKPSFVKGYEARTKPRQIEIWLARPDAAEIGRLLQLINAATPEERKPAAQQLLERYSASPLAIAEALALFRSERIDALSSSGRINTLYFLTRTAPLAWDATLVASGREVVERFRSRGNVGEQTTAELKRLSGMLDAVGSGDSSSPDNTPNR